MMEVNFNYGNLRFEIVEADRRRDEMRTNEMNRGLYIVYMISGAVEMYSDAFDAVFYNPSQIVTKSRMTGTYAILDYDQEEKTGFRLAKMIL